MKITRDTFISRWRLQFDHYWPYLDVLHNPPSLLHWAIALRILRASAFEESFSCLEATLPCLIIAAARYGLANLGNSSGLKEIALTTILDPLDGEKWQNLLTKFEPEINLFLRDNQTVSAEIWRPPGHAPATTERETINKTCNRPHVFDFRASPPMQNAWRDACGYLDDIRHAYNSRPSFELDKFNVTVDSVSLDTVEENQRNCMICLENMVDLKTIEESLRKAALQEIDLAKKKPTLSDLPNNLEPWMKELKRICESVLSKISKEDDKPIMEDITKFSYRLICAYSRRQILLNQSRELDGTCSDPVKLPCGHIMGFSCIETWLEENDNCPYCRQDVSPIKALVKALYNKYRSQIMAATRAIRRLNSEFPVEHARPLTTAYLRQVEREIPLDPELMREYSNNEFPELRKSYHKIARQLHKGRVAEHIRLERYFALAVEACSERLLQTVGNRPELEELPTSPNDANAVQLPVPAASESRTAEPTSSDVSTPDPIASNRANSTTPTRSDLSIPERSSSEVPTPEASTQTQVPEQIRTIPRQDSTATGPTASESNALEPNTSESSTPEPLNTEPSVSVQLTLTPENIRTARLLHQPRANNSESERPRVRATRCLRIVNVPPSAPAPAPARLRSQLPVEEPGPQPAHFQPRMEDQMSKAERRHRANVLSEQDEWTREEAMERLEADEFREWKKRRADREKAESRSEQRRKVRSGGVERGAQRPRG